MKKKTIIILFLIILVVFLIYIKTRDNSVYYVNLTDEHIEKIYAWGYEHVKE